MRKLFIFLGIMSISLVLVGCTGTATEVTPPTYTGILVENIVPVDGTEYLTFYRAKQETVLVEVDVVNPDNLVIKAIVINGITYNSHRFTEDSTNTNIYFEMSVGNVVGSTTYSVDRISYLNGENTFTIENFTNNLFEVFVYKETPTVERENYLLDRDSVIIDFDITDDDDVIIADSLIAKLYIGDEFIKEELLEKGLATVDFSGLLANRQYEVKVEASYDLLDGNGVIANQVLYSGTYSTVSNGLPSASINTVVISSNSVSFNVEFTDTDSVISIGSLKAIIFKGDERLTDAEYTKLISGSTGGLSFANLLNNVEYTIKVLADYDMSDGNGVLEDNILATYTIETLSREVPTPQLVNMNILENSISFGINIDDLIGIIDKDTLVANLYIDDEFIISSNVTELYFDVYVSNLFSNKSFRIELLADYDLNDGKGAHVNQVIFDEEFSTQENFRPSVVINDMVDTQGYLTVELDVNDPSSTLIGSLWAVLYEEDVIVKTIYFDSNETVLVFDYATVSGTNYYLEIYADYNLRDGDGAELSQSLIPAVLLSIEPKAPIAEISSVVTSTSSVSLDVVVIDADVTIDPGSIKVYLYLGDSIVPVETIAFDPNVNLVEFDSLDILSDNSYTIIVKADYDLEDGSGLLLDQEIASQVVSTLAKELPTYDFDLRDTTYDSITFDLDVDDSDGVLIPSNTLQAILMLNNAPAVGVAPIDLTSAVNSLKLFDDLYSNQGYTINFVAVYDLNDGTYDGTSEVVYTTGELVTDSYQKPTATDIEISTTIDSIILTVSIEDLDDVIDSNLEAVVYLGTTIITSKPLLEVLDQTITLDGLDSETEYLVKIEADYDLKEVSGLVVDGLLYKKEAETLPLTPPTVSISNALSTTDSLTVDIFLDNTAGTITGNRFARIYKDGSEVVGKEVVLVDNDNLLIPFNGLLSDTEYEVRVYASYDLNDLDGVQNEVLGTTLVYTLPRTVPSVSISNLVISHTEISFDYELVDEYGVLITNDVSAVLTVGTDVVSKTLLTNTVTFGLSGFLASQDFKIEIIGDYNLNSGDGDQLNEVIQTLEFTTSSYEAPSATINDVTVNQDNVAVNVTVIDNDSTSVGIITAELYDDASEIVAIATISNLVIGDNNIEFGVELDYQRMYSIVIVSDYNLRDGVGTIADVKLHEFVVEEHNKKLPQATISNVIIGQDSIIFDVDITDNDDVIEAGTMEAVIYLNGLPIENIPLVGLSSTAVTNTITLDSNKSYEVRIETSYDNEDGNLIQVGYVTAVEAFITDAKQAPTAEINIDFSTVDSIQFDVDIDNPDNVASVREAYIYNEDGIQVGSAIDLLNANSNNINILVSTLYSNHTYTISVELTYDLDDGNGPITEVVTSKTQTTATKNVPTGNITLDNYTATINSLTVTFDYTDTDNVATTYVRVYDGITLVSEFLVSTTGIDLIQAIGSLDSSKEYTITLETSYDLNDLDGNQTATLASITANTVPLSAPTAVVSNPVILTESITVDIFLDNADGTISGNRFARLYLAGVLVPGSETVLVDGENTFGPIIGLQSNTEYEVRVYVDYNLNGTHTGDLLESYNVTTAAKAVPTVTLSNVVITHDAITFDYEIVDEYGVLITDDINAVLTVNSDVVSKTLLTNTVSFGLSGFLASQDLKIEFIGDYNLNDVVGDQTTQVIATFDFSTASYEAPSATINNVTVNQTNVTANVTVTDNDNTTIGSITAYLYDDTNPLAAPLATIPNLVIGDNDLEFGVVLDYQRMYSIVVIADYNLRDGELVHPAVELHEFVVEEHSKGLPEAVISNVVVGQDTIDFEVNIYDKDLTIEAGTTYAVLYLDNVEVVGKRIELVGASPYTEQFAGLLSDTYYEIRIETNYDLDDAAGIVAADLLPTTRTTTLAKEAPSAEVFIDFSTASDIQFDVVITDVDGIATLSEAYIYDKFDNQIGAVIALPIASNINLTNSVPLLSDTLYTIIVKITYDLNDGNGVVTEDVVIQSKATIANVAPSGNISEVTATTDSVLVTYDYEDNDGIATSYLNVYANGLLVKGEELTTNGDDLTQVIDGLDPFVQYTVKIDSTYDLEDLNGIQTEELSDFEIETMTFIVIDVETEVLDSESNTLIVTIDDIDDILVDATNIEAKITQYDSGLFHSYLIETDGITTLELADLLSDNTYVLEISATYNSDGTPETNVVYSYTFETPARELPTVTIDASTEWVSVDNGTAATSTLTVGIVIGADDNEYVTDSSWTAYLYNDGVVVDTIDLTAPEATTQSVTFTGASLDYVGSYTVVVKADVDVNIYDGLDPNSGFQDSVIAQRTVVSAGN